MKNLGYCIKKLTNKIQKLTLNLSRNGLGDNIENIKLFSKALKLPTNLNHLILNLWYNKLGRN